MESAETKMIKKKYEKPILTIIELKADEVLSSCNKQPGICSFPGDPNTKDS